MSAQVQAEQDLICSGCGHPRDETMVPEEDAPDYEAQAVRCHACLARERAGAKFAGREKTDPTAALYFSIHSNGG